MKLYSKYYFAATLLLGITFTACENKTATTAEDATKQAENENDVKFDDKKAEADAQFLVDASAFCLEQIKLGTQATRKGGKDTKGLSGMLVKDHSKMLSEIRKLAETKQVSIPDTASTDAYNAVKDLEPKTGFDFEGAYYKRVVDEYQKSIAQYEKEISDSREQDIKAWATTALPQLRTQLDSVFALQKKVPKP